MCAVNSAQPLLTSRCATRPLGSVAATPWTPLRNSGWWVTSRCAPSATASSATAVTGSTASRIRRTSAAGSPSTSPTASQLSAWCGGYHSSSSAVISPRVGMQRGYGEHGASRRRPSPTGSRRTPSRRISAWSKASSSASISSLDRAPSGHRRRRTPPSGSMHAVELRQVGHADRAVARVAVGCAVRRRAACSSLGAQVDPGLLVRARARPPARGPRRPRGSRRAGPTGPRTAGSHVVRRARAAAPSTSAQRDDVDGDVDAGVVRHRRPQLTCRSRPSQ